MTFLDECKRVLKLSHRPNRYEYVTTAKVAGVGLFVVGMLGFIIFAIIEIFR